jgi:hypothetical protein
MVDINTLFNDPNFISTLAGMGAGFGRGRAGEFIGKPVQQMVQNVAAQKSTAANNERTAKFWQQLIAALQGATPAGTPGLTGIKTKAGGDVTMDITPPSSAAAAGVSTPTAPAAQPSGNFNLSDILPF